VVVKASSYDDCALVTLDGRDHTNRGVRARLLSPFDELKPEGEGTSLRRRSRPALAASALAGLARARPVDGLWTAADARLALLPWQLSPALAVLAGTTRLLLADEVGLGKTIQAGLILSELVARGWVDRALVLTPPALRQSWADELELRFGLRAAVLDHDALMESAIDMPWGANPWAVKPLVISSIDLAKRPEIRAAIEDHPLDLLVVDEAHHLTPGTDRGALVTRLARRVPWIVLATATPHAGDTRRFRYLVDLGRTDASDRMRVFRRTKADVGLDRKRRSHILPVRPTDAESALLSSIHAYATAMRRGPAASVPGLRLLSSIIARRATSSALAIERTLARRLALLSSSRPAHDERQPTLPWSESEESDGVPEVEWLAMPGLSDVGSECEWLRVLVAQAAAARRHPSKLVRLERFLRRTAEPAIVFTEFRDTLDACRPVASAVAPVVCLHGGLDVRARADALAEFTSGRAPLLLATDVASEGLNLQDRCRLVVTIEWPWSPERIEQRIGRVDRIGQTRPVHAVHLTARGTFEEAVVARLLQRRHVAEQDLQLARMPAERDVESVVFDEPSPRPALAAASYRSATDDPAAAREAARLGECRRLASLAAGRAAPRTGWSGPASGTRGGRVAVVVELTALNRHGLMTSRHVFGVTVSLARRPLSKHEWRALCVALGTWPGIREAAEPHLPAVTRRLAQAVARVEGLRTLLAGERMPTVQASLFDRRALEAADHHRARIARIDDNLRRVQHALRDHSRARVEMDVLAVLPLGGPER
jgi:superfamily II DNA or RNA helicase